MITPKIKALFQFIEFLHSNIEKFNKYNDLIKELESLKTEKNNLNPENNYKDRIKFQELQVKLESNFKTLQNNTSTYIKVKAEELDLCNFENEPNYSFNGVEDEIRQLKKTFRNEDLPEIFKYKNQYLEYRSQTHKSFLSLELFFEDLDEIAKNLFDYFKDTKQNEFEPFETKAILVNSFEEAIQRFNNGQTKITLPNSVLFNTSTIEQQKIETLPLQPNLKQKLGLQEIGNKIKELENKLKELEISNNKGVEEKNVKTFIEYFNPEQLQREQLAESLKKEFNVEIGKSIKILINLLKEKKLLLLPERDFLNFYNSMKKYFDRKIGSYASINDFKYSKELHKKDLDSINTRLEKVIKDHEKQENSL